MFELISLIIDLLGLFRRSPPEQRHAILAKVRGAFSLADAVDAKTGAASNDTSAIEDLVNH